MKSLKTFGLVLLGLLLAGFGCGYIVGFIEDSESALSASLLIGIVPIPVGAFLVYLGFRGAGNPADQEGDASDLDMIFGDMSDPVQRRILSRTAVAGALHGIILVALVGGDLAPLGAGGGWITIVLYAAFVLTLIWVVVECILFHNIDEFWARVALGPAALAGAGLFVAVISWMVAEELFAVPEARFWWFYLFYYVLLVGLLLGKWQRSRAGRA